MAVNGALNRGAEDRVMKVERNAVPCFALLLALAACGSLPHEPASGDRAAMLAADRGCGTCHAPQAPALGRGPVPIAPAWAEIAARYRQRPGAEEELVRVLVEGTEERHWKGEPLVSMLPHEKWLTEEESRALVRWILAR